MKITLKNQPTETLRIGETCNQPLYYPGPEGITKHYQSLRTQYNKLKNMTTEQYAKTYCRANSSDIQKNLKQYQKLHRSHARSIKNQKIINEEKFINEQIAQLIHLIEKPCLMQTLFLLKNGYTTTASNAYGPGAKGVWFIANKKKYFFALNNTLWANVPEPSYNCNPVNLNSPQQVNIETIKDLPAYIKQGLCTAQNKHISPKYLTWEDILHAIQQIDQLDILQNSKNNLLKK